MTKIKKALPLLLVVLLFLSACQSVGLDITTNDMDISSSIASEQMSLADTYETNNEGHVVYCGSYDSLMDSIPFCTYTIKNVEGINFKSINQIEYKIIHPVSVTETKENISKKQFLIDGKTYIGEYVGSKTNDLAQSQNGTLKKLGIADVYKYRNGDDVRVEIECLENSDIVTWFFLSGNGIGHVEGDFTAEQAAEAGREAIGTLYGEEVLKDYTPENVYFGVTTETWNVVYTRYVYGYPTTDSICLSYTLKGDLISINAKNFGQMAVAEEQLSLGEMEMAMQILTDAIGHESTMNLLSVNGSGQYYMQTVDSIAVTTDTNEETRSTYLLCVLVG